MAAKTLVFRAMLSALLCSYCVSAPASGMALEASTATRFRSLLCRTGRILRGPPIPGICRDTVLQQICQMAPQT